MEKKDEVVRGEGERWVNPMPSYISLFRMGVKVMKEKLAEWHKTILGKRDKSPEEIIPRDCWELVFEKLNAEDLRSCRVVCKSFRDWADLSKFKVKWRLDSVLPLLRPYLASSEGGGRTVSWQSLHNIRLTCSSWGESVDKFVSEVYEPTGFSQWCSAMPLITKLRNLEEIEDFQDRFGEWERNPFPARAVCIRNCEEIYDMALDEDDERYEEREEMIKIFQFKFMERVGDLLEHFGRNISKLHLNFREEYSYSCAPLSMCKFIKRITIHLPNLRAFRIHNSTDEFDSEEEVSAYKDQNQLASLPKLKTLVIIQLDKAVEDYLLSACAPQLINLHKLCDFCEDGCSPSKVRMQQFENLRNMSFYLRSAEDCLDEFQFLKSPLEYLKVTCRFRSGEARSSLKVDKVLRNLKHLPVNDLQIRLWGCDRVAMKEVGLPQEEYINESIKTLHIQVENFLEDQTMEYNISFDFLTSLKALDTLYLEFSQLPTTAPPRHSSSSGRSAYVDLLECMMDGEWKEKVRFSNVWKKVRSLKKLVIFRTRDPHSAYVLMR